MAEFKGVYPAIITPMTPEGDLNEDVFRAVMEDNIQAGVHGFWVAGGSGESVLLTDDENMRIAEIAADQNRGRTNVIMHVGTTTTSASARLAEHAARQNVEAICAVPNFFYGTSEAATVEHFRAIGAAADLPLFAYNLPDSTGVEVTVDLMARLRDAVPQLAGLKHSSDNFHATAEYAALGVDCFVGSGRLLLPALTVGAIGCIDGPPCAAPELWLEIWSAYNEGDLKRAEAAQKRATDLYSLVLGRPFPSSVKAMISERLGIDCGSGRLPLQPLSREERGEIARGMAERGLVKVAA